jgi:two-component system, NarL family, nitrate/nitrite response regulator NarL
MYYPCVSKYIFDLTMFATMSAPSQELRNDPRVVLSKRETEVLHLLADGLSAKQIASELAISPSTVTQHISRIYEKLGVHNAVAAVRLAIRSGLIAA